jgi:GntR family transcriptional regulator
MADQRIARRPEHQATVRGGWRGFHLAAEDAGLTPWSETTEIMETTATDWVAGNLGIEDGATVLRRSRRHGIEDADRRVPVMLSWTWVHPDVLAELPILRESDTGPGGMSGRFEEAGWSVTWEETVTTLSATRTEAAGLQVREGAALLDVVRVCRDQAGRVLEMTRRVINPARHILVYPIG